MENFYEHPLVKEIYEFIDSKEFRVLREYRNQIAHTNIRDISRLRSITRNLVDLIPQMPEQEALVIKVIKKKLPTIIKMVDEANKYS